MYFLLCGNEVMKGNVSQGEFGFFNWMFLLHHSYNIRVHSPSGVFLFTIFHALKGQKLGQMKTFS